MKQHPPDGLTTDELADWRKMRKAERDREWWAANREKALARKHKWYAANCEKAKERGREWRAANPEKVKIKGRRWRTANPEYNKVKTREWRAANPEKAKAQSREWYAANPDRVRDKQIKNKYGITLGQKCSMLEDQDWGCAICKTPLDAYTSPIDHCHKTKAIRGVLCETCNRGLGHFKDSPERLRAAADYLEKFT